MFYAEFRARARKSLSGKWISMTFIHFIYVMLNGIFSGIALFGGVLLGLAALNNANKISLFDNWAKDIDRATELILKEAYGSDYEEVVYRFIKSTAKTMSDIIPVLIVIIIIAIVLWCVVGSMITAGLYKQYYNLAVGDEISISGLFGAIKLWPKMLGVTFFKYALSYAAMGLWFVTIAINQIVAIVTLPIFIILACYIIYKFTMAPYLLVDEEDISLMESITKSMSLMKGHVKNIFCLYITFIGWSFVASLVGGIAQNIIPLASTIASSVLTIYIAIAVTHYYLYLTGQDAYVFMKEGAYGVVSEVEQGFGQGIDLDLNNNTNDQLDLNTGTQQVNLQPNDIGELKLDLSLDDDDE